MKSSIKTNKVESEITPLNRSTEVRKKMHSLAACLLLVATVGIQGKLFY